MDMIFTTTLAEHKVLPDKELGFLATMAALRRQHSWEAGAALDGPWQPLRPEHMDAELSRDLVSRRLRRIFRHDDNEVENPVGHRSAAATVLHIAFWGGASAATIRRRTSVVVWPTIFTGRSWTGCMICPCR